MSAIRLNGTSSGYTELAPPAAAGSNTITLPSSNGSANQFLKNGSTAGTLGWSSMVETATGVGIGTTSPVAFLQTAGTSGSPQFRAGTATNGYFEINAFDSNPVYCVIGGANATAGVIGTQSNIPFILFSNNAERARITSGGYFKASNDAVYVGTTGSYHELRSTANEIGLITRSVNASYSTSVNQWGCTRSQSSSYQFLLAWSDIQGSADAEFNLRGDGQAYADQSWNGGGADYAEYFEWEDGNPDAEDRRGYPVALVGNKIKIAEDGDTIIGIVSAAPVVLGDAAWNHWSGKYLKDDFGSYIMEPHQVVEWTDADGKFHSYEDWSLPDGVIIPADATWKSVDENGKPFEHRKLNPDYDPTQPYVPREDRPEWSPIGLMGKLRLRKGQPVAANWLKLRDISATVEEWLVR